MTQPFGPPPPFDREFRLFFDNVPQPLPALTEEQRIAGRTGALSPLELLTLDGTYDVSEIEGDGIEMVLARPAGADGPTPCIYLLHYGGMIGGDPRSAALPVLQYLAGPLGLSVVSAKYRLAPDVQAPLLAEDGFTGLHWVADHAVEIGVDPDRIILMGISGGGGLAASCALMARDRNGPSLRGVLLMYPQLDDRLETPSTHQMSEVGIWRKPDNEFAWNAVLGQRRGAPDVTYEEAAARATDLSGLPPTYLDAGSAETFRDEIVDYAQRIWLAGGQADLHVWDGAFHGFDLGLPDSSLGRASWQNKRDWVTRQLRA